MAALTGRVRDLSVQVANFSARTERLAGQQEALTARVDALAVQTQLLAVQMNQLTQRVDNLAEQMAQLTQRVDCLTQRVDDLTEQMVQLTRRVDDLTTQVQELTYVQRGMLVDMGEMKGKLGEMLYRARAYGHFGGIVRRARVIEGEQFWDLVEEALRSGRLTRDEEEQVRWANLIVSGLYQGPPPG
jgi:uncharacterized protein YoxC